MDRRNNVALTRRFAHLGMLEGEEITNTPRCLIDDNDERARKSLRLQLTSTPRGQKWVAEAQEHMTGHSAPSIQRRSQQLTPAEPSACVPVVTGAGWVPWPKSTDLLCWHCCHGFDTVPVPAVSDFSERRNIMQVHGNFCSWACSKAWMLRNNSHARVVYLHRLARAGREPIATAPPRDVLRVFGGHMSITDFRGGSAMTWVPCDVPYELQMRQLALWGEPCRRGAKRAKVSTAASKPKSQPKEPSPEKEKAVEKASLPAAAKPLVKTLAAPKSQGALDTYFS